MPIYCFECECGATAEKMRDVDSRNMPVVCHVCGRMMSRDLRAELGSVETEWSPDMQIHSNAMGVHPDQISEAMAHDRRLGCPVEYDRAGRPVFTSKSQRRRYIRAHGVVDQAGYYD